MVNDYAMYMCCKTASTVRVRIAMLCEENEEVLGRLLRRKEVNSSFTWLIHLRAHGSLEYSARARLTFVSTEGRNGRIAASQALVVTESQQEEHLQSMHCGAGS